MRQLLLAIGALVLVLTLPGSRAMAGCYLFTNGGAIRVCVRGDSWAQRQKARRICHRIKGSHCGAISRTTEGCRSTKKMCYDEDGKAHEHLDDPDRKPTDAG